MNRFKNDDDDNFISKGQHQMNTMKIFHVICFFLNIVDASNFESFLAPPPNQLFSLLFINIVLNI